jgi:hypothetical protein
MDTSQQSQTIVSPQGKTLIDVARALEMILEKRELLDDTPSKISFFEAMVLEFAYLKWKMMILFMEKVKQA